MYANKVMDIVIPQKSMQDNYKVLSPGLVGPVGDVLMATRLRNSNAAMFPVRFEGDPMELPTMGSALQDGDTRNQINGNGLPARLNAYKWNIKQSTRTDVGDRWQDLRQNTRYVEPVVVGSNQYDFKNLVAQTVHARTTGNAFMPLVNGLSIQQGYGLGDQLSRGGTIPSVVLSAGGSITPMVEQDKFGRLFASFPMAPSTTTGPKDTKDTTKDTGTGSLTQDRPSPSGKNLTLLQTQGSCGKAGNKVCTFK